jgi:predicted nucleic acid-binding protein
LPSAKGQQSLAAGDGTLRKTAASQAACNALISAEQLAAALGTLLIGQAQHRSTSIADLIVAATARARGLEILHYDRDFDTIARFTEQPTHWVVPPGTV